MYPSHTAAAPGRSVDADVTIQCNLAVIRFRSIENTGPEFAQRPAQTSFQLRIGCHDLRSHQFDEFLKEKIRYMISDEFLPALRKAVPAAQDALRADVMPGIGFSASALGRLPQAQDCLIVRKGPRELRV